MKNKNIVLGVTGGIAAYKSAELVRMLRQNGANVKVIMTKNATEFITPLTMQTLSGHVVYKDMFTKDSELDLEHIALARWAEAIIVAPATANFIAKLANGLADDLLSTVCLATTAPIAIAPAMNKEMWHAAVTKENVATLIKRGILMLGPESGEQACGELGCGRMLSPQQILETLPKLWASQTFLNKKIVITAGPTREAIDPVRYISNRSSGKMGYALAAAAAAAGAEVVLVSGPTNLDNPDPTKIKLINVQSAMEMQQATMAEIANCNVFIATAAVADYKPKNVQVQKIKKSKNNIHYEFVLNPDILAEVTRAVPKVYSVGFAAETENLLKNAKSKLRNKKLDMIIANLVGDNLGFNSDENSVVVIENNAEPIELAKSTKNKIAEQIIEIIYSRYIV